ncbi:hypothetical protein F6X40_23900 [Paraburkholderia sp. UCT31]|uniref:hypothetical protein n=1 Tax=Paraburkholderia sp. UCT31 TaxID=2615209 RepID=UPI00165634AB|nr:hypothetical protein [Paraburkholderia sp. UCT31]MBC8739760.1 hypothetical protein [Paraburkholderia sp. UCT31]
MKTVRFISRAEAVRLAAKRDAAVISIHDKSESPATLKSGWADVLVLRFHDTDGQLMGLEVFSAEQAQSVKSFVERVGPRIDELIVHCALGQSRSAGLAMFLAKHYGVPCFKGQLPVSESYRIYNKKVFSMMDEAYYGPIGSAFENLPPEV